MRCLFSSPRFLRAVCITAALLMIHGNPGDGAEAEPPRVIEAWAADPFEARVAFDRPVSPALAGAVVGRTIAFDESRTRKTALVSGKTVSADARGTLKVTAARLDDGGRTLVMTTDPHPRAGTYTLELPPLGAGGPTRVEYDLTGVEVAWDDGTENARPAWTGWWPSLDPADVRKAVAGAAGPERGLALLEKPGRLSLTTLVTLPRGRVTLGVVSSSPADATLGGEEPTSRVENAAKLKLPRFVTESTGEPTLLTLVVTRRAGDPPAAFGVELTQAGDSASKPVAPVGRDRLSLPWAPPTPASPPPPENVPDLTGGDPRKGLVVFAGNEAKCANCHKARGQGGNVGPDLDNQVGRDRKDVYRDIYEPSARIHPDYVPYTLALKDGRVVVGTVRAEGADAVRVTDTEARSVVIPRKEIEEFRPSATSIMPVGLVGAIGEERLRDLIAFLTTPAAK